MLGIVGAMTVTMLVVFAIIQGTKRAKGLPHVLVWDLSSWPHTPEEYLKRLSAGR